MVYPVARSCTSVSGLVERRASAGPLEYPLGLLARQPGAALVVEVACRALHARHPLGDAQRPGRVTTQQTGQQPGCRGLPHDRVHRTALAKPV
jgi:hypothetical protein